MSDNNAEMITIENYKEKIESYNSMFSALCLINQNNPAKLGIHDNKLYKCWNTFSGLQRTYYGENRDTLIEFLENNFSMFCDFYNKLFVLLNENRNNGLIHELATTIEVTRINMNHWCSGLRGLQQNYPEDEDFNGKINTIISCLTTLQSKKIM